MSHNNYSFMESFMGHGETREEAYLDGLRDLIASDEGAPSESHGSRRFPLLTLTTGDHTNE